jgi:3-oxoacyl-[acyl-carrier-protein] synthase III
MTIDDAELLISKQANARIIQSFIELTGIRKRKALTSIAKYANTSAASISSAINDFGNDFFSAGNIVLQSTGAGFIGCLRKFWHDPFG